jgi:hypothetical protein
MESSSGKKYLCMQCDLPEVKCACVRYCFLCQSEVDVRLCEDGMYYCVPCREACDYSVAD